MPVADSVPDLLRPRRVHVIGVGGSGMSAIATVLAGMGHRVSGSDAADSDVLRRLAAAGLKVHAGHDPAWISDSDLVVHSTAVPPSDVEVVEARRRGVEVRTRADLLAAICAKRRTIAVSGTHGKTTTSSLLALIVGHAGLHPSMVVGGEIAGLGPGARWDPAGEWMVVEADESDGTFLRLGAEAVVVTSVEPDHLDFYGGEAEMRAAYRRFVVAAPGPAVLCADDPGAAALSGLDRPAGAPVVTYGTSATADVRITACRLGRLDSEFSLAAESGEVGPVTLAAPGLHNVRNAAGAMAAANAVGVSWDVAAAGVGTFRGVGRRFEVRGERAGVTFVDDYGHLPAEVKAALDAARAGGWSRVVAVFQPHRYSRTEALGRDFAGAFAGADVVIVTDVYPAGESPRPGVSGELVYSAVRAARPGDDVRYVASLDEVVGELGTLLRPGDLCLTLGAGDLTTVPGRLLAGEGFR
jgi:UDP-N-acetylmuramate--alanine ligase